VALVAGALAFAHFAWPSGQVRLDSIGLARVSGPSFGGAGARISVRSATAAVIPVRLGRQGRLWPKRPVEPGTRLFVDVVFRRPSWVGWIAGGTQTVRLQLRAPRAQVTRRWLRLQAGAPLRVSFDRPVRRLELTGDGPPRTRVLPRAQRTVSMGRSARAGSMGVSAVPRSWERLPAAETVTWFPAGGAAAVLASPRPGSRLGLDTPLELRFSEPVERLLHGRLPSLQRPVAGRWRTVDARTLVFTPRGYGFGLDTPVRVQLPVPVERAGAGSTPGRTITWTTPAASSLRLQQLLALLGYLPLTWIPKTSDAPRTIRGEVAAAIDPPSGHFSWRYPNTPRELRTLWSVGEPNAITRGAVMRFEDDHGLAVDGFAGADMWRALMAA
jgi:hypothetical protein